MISDYLRLLRLFSRDLRLFMVSAALVGLAWDGMRGVLLNLYLLRLGYGPETIGLINSVGTLVFGVACLPAGAMGTRWGSRRLLIGGMTLMVAGSGLLPCAEFVPASSRTGCLLAASALSSLGFALYLVNGLPFQMATTGGEERNHAFSFHVSLSPLAASVGCLLAGALPAWIAGTPGVSLDDPLPYRLPLWLASLALIPGVVALLRTSPDRGRRAPPPNTNTKGSGSARAPWTLLMIVGLIMALRFGGRGAIITFFNIYLDDGLGTSPAVIGALTASAQLLSVPVALVAPLVVTWGGSRRTILWGMAGTALLALPLAIIPHWAAAGLGLMGSSAFFVLTVGPLRLFSQELVAPRWRASMAAAFMMGAGLAFSVTSLLGGYAIALLGYRTLFLVSAGLVAASGAIFGLYFARARGEMACTPEREAAERI